MPNQPWFRFYSEALDDLKLDRAAYQTEQPRVVILGAWVGLLALANDSAKRGQLLLGNDLPLLISEMAYKIGIDKTTLHEIIGAFEALNMVHWEECSDSKALTITNMHKRQFISDVSTPRVQKHRERKKQEETPEPKESETLQKRYGNIPDTDTDTEQNREDLPPLAGACAPNLTPPEPKSPPSEPEKPKTKGSLRPDHAMFDALASLCYGDTSVMSKKMRGTLNRTGKTLRDGGATADQCAEFAEWWYACDWRGRKKQKPTPALVVECWGAFREWCKGGKKIVRSTGSRRSTILAAETEGARDHNTPSPEQLEADRKSIAALRERQQARASAG